MSVRGTGPSMLACGARGIDLWLTWYDDAHSPSLQAAMRLLLNEAERAQEVRFHFADDRLRYLVTRAMVRTVLSRYAAVAPAAWEFVANAYGRPELAAHHGAAALRFNISHTRGLIVLAVSTGRELGVDVEYLAARSVAAGIAEHFFSPREVAALAALPAAQQQSRFFEYWTFKEAYIKARGMGLSLPLDRFGFDLSRPGAVQPFFDQGCDDGEPQRWCFWQAQPAPGYLLALCAERSMGAVPAITVRTVLPLVSEAPVELAWLRATGQAPCPAV
ncbi:4'-phosphopantetheinyl transferase superfamily protein [Massilia sp. PAMC28688]|uniref:4'-phosphopantetheinyl transferase family protein n=1 Tax=Massilia sp. PAMC28688 TaxID=2861283 RepID=UPI001C62BBF5|nr:4'-phosphopantetheinyl transferase superfamily protein [Massilia sp. PAMC28688]QYF92981.1 4'-phosphopantetheinyl transferase superfamily protein [Massilia sp. PAMC28688]